MADKRADGDGAPSMFMTAGEAGEALGVSKHKIAALIAAGTLASQPDSLDKRRKLVLRADVEALAAQSRGKEAA